MRIAGSGGPPMAQAAHVMRAARQAAAQRAGMFTSLRQYLYSSSLSGNRSWPRARVDLTAGAHLLLGASVEDRIDRASEAALAVRRGCGAARDRGQLGGSGEVEPLHHRQ